MKLHTAYAFFTALALCSCAIINPIGKKQTLISELPAGEYKKSTLAVGEEKDLAQQRGQGLGFVRNEKWEAYLGKVHDKLLERSGVTGVPGKVILTANSEFNAKSTADGNIYITTSAFQQLDSEDEVAALIGHELGHVLLTHFNSEILSKTQNEARAVYEMGMSVKRKVDDKPAHVQEDERNLIIAEVVSQAGDKVVMPAWKSKQETAADYLGIDLLVRAGYSPVAMKTVLEKLKGSQADKKEAEEAFQKRLHEVVKRDPSEAVTTFVNHVFSTIFSDHPDTGARITDVNKYIERHYRDVSIPDDRESWSKIQSDPSVEDVLRNYKEAFDANDALMAGKADEAYTHARAAVSEPTATAAFPNWVLARSEFAKGRRDKGFKALHRARKSNEPSQQIYYEIISRYEGNGNINEALEWTDEAAAAFRDPWMWMPTKIRLLRKAGRANEAAGLTAVCSASGPDLRHMCQKENKSSVMKGRG